MHRGSTGPPAGPGLEQVAVVVPLHEVDRVLGEHGAHPVEQVVADLRAGQVEDELVPLEHRPAGTCAEDPVRVGPEEVGVGVDHLGLEPQPELHAEAADVLDQRVQAVGPDRRVDPPVAQPRGVVAAVPEPAVVEDEPLDPDPGRAVRDAAQPGQVVVEEDGLPDVQDDRLHLRVARQRALPGVPGRGQPVETVVRGGDVDPRGRVGRALGQDHLPGLEELASTDGGPGGGVPLDAQDGVAAPADVDAEDLTLGGGEAGCPDDAHGRGVEPGPAAAGLPQPQPVGDVAALRRALALVPAGEVQDLGEVVRHGEDDLEPVQRVAAGSVVGERVAAAQATAREALELEGQPEPGVLVAGRQREHPVPDGQVLGPEAGRPVAALAVPAQVRTREPVVRVLTQQPHRDGRVRGRVVLGLTGAEDARPVHQR